MTDQNTPTVYLKRSCPHCLKLRIFLTEAGLAHQVNFSVFDDGDEDHKALRARMENAGQKPSFPAVEFTSGKLETETDDLIARFAQQAGVNPDAMPLLTYYIEGVYKQYSKMFRELRELRAMQPS